MFRRIAHRINARFLRFAQPWISKAFHKLLYEERGAETWQKTTWMGANVLKIPFDLWVQQEILWETKPQIIVECGTFDGGSTYYYAHLLDLLGEGEVVSIDIDVHPNRPDHPRITYIEGSSTDLDIIATVKKKCEGKKVMVILDSDHRTPHVRRELELWPEVVTPGCYLIIEDTNVNSHPVSYEHGPGPMEAVRDWAKTNPPFDNDPGREKYLVSFHPFGYWKKRG